VRGATIRPQSKFEKNGAYLQSFDYRAQQGSAEELGAKVNTESMP
jgi:hypothetical protein